MKELILLLGGNIGEVQLQFKKATEILSIYFGEPIKKSSLYKTAAWGKRDQPDFLNQVISFKTKLNPSEVLAKCLETENDLGRIRYERWGERAIDIDVLFYGTEVIDIKGLIIPHPRIQERLFTLEPLSEIYPEYIHPVLNKSVKIMLEECNDPLEVHKI